MCVSPRCAQLGCLQDGIPQLPWAVLVFLSAQGRPSKHLLAGKPPWLLARDTQSFSLKAEGSVQSPTVTSGSIRRGKGEERTVSETWGI